jgi:hypothetical protein
VIKTCDEAIAKRNDLINLQANRIDQLKDQNQELSEAIVKLSRENENATDWSLTYGAIGLVLGVLAGALIHK